MRDYPELDATTASISASGTTLTVADTTIYFKNQKIQVEQEAMLVRALASGTTLTVFRGASGTAAAVHASGATILVSPAFYDVEYLDALNYAVDSMYPYVYKEVEDTSLTTSTNVYEYSIPNEASTAKPIRALSRVELKQPGSFTFNKSRTWRVNRGATPTIVFYGVPVKGSIIRLHGYSPFSDLTLAGSTDAQFPDDALDTLTLGAAEYLTAAGETGRVRTDVGPTDSRENANRVGSSLAVSNALLGRFERSLQRHAMAPLPRSIIQL